jgi:hypothetical protein
MTNILFLFVDLVFCLQTLKKASDFYTPSPPPLKDHNKNPPTEKPKKKNNSKCALMAVEMNSIVWPFFNF